MALLDLWNSDRNQVTEKRIDQLIAFAGEGQLRDGNRASTELRQLLAAVPSDLLGKWIDECLQNRFQDFGFVVQDIVNEIGRRLGFVVTPGVYRGHTNEGFDGFWRSPNGGIVVESKSSTSYSIQLNRIAEYRKQISPRVDLPPEDISILLIVATHDTTEELEAQVRGSRFAWDIRLLGVHSLFRLLKLRESLDDPAVERQIQGILVPQEFTRLDRIIDLVFATAEDASDIDDGETVELVIDTDSDIEAATPPARFHDEIIPNLERHFGVSLVKRSRVIWASPDDAVGMSCQVSKEYSRNGPAYWFGLKATTEELLGSYGTSYCVFGLGSSSRILIIPYPKIREWVDTLWKSEGDAGKWRHWHFRFHRRDEQIELSRAADYENVDVSDYLLSSSVP